MRRDDVVDLARLVKKLKFCHYFKQTRFNWDRVLVEIVFLSEQAAADLNQLWLKSDLGQFCLLDLIEDFNDGADRFV